jgi:putative glutamine amidotransferase
MPHWRAPTFERTRHYHEALRQAGAEPLVIDDAKLPADAAGLLLPGGVDIDPHRYGEKRAPETDRPNKARDEHELGLLAQALERDVPVLAVCRGHELLNVALGGSLLQHIQGEGHRHAASGGELSGWHEVTLSEDGSLLAAVYGKGRKLRVNSRHHQCVTGDRLSPQLKAVAGSPDGVVEAVESPSHRWVVGVQWHPERPEMRPAADPLFEAFVAACRDG